MVIIADALLEHETLNNEQIESLYKNGVMLEMHDGKVQEMPKDIVFPEAAKTPDPVDLDDDLLDEMK